MVFLRFSLREGRLRSSSAAARRGGAHERSRLVEAEAVALTQTQTQITEQDSRGENSDADHRTGRQGRRHRIHTEQEIRRHAKGTRRRASRMRGGGHGCGCGREVASSCHGFSGVCVKGFMTMHQSVLVLPEASVHQSIRASMRASELDVGNSIKDGCRGPRI